MKKIPAILLGLSLLASMAGCGSDGGADGSAPSQGADGMAATSLNTADMFTPSDQEIGYDESSATAISLAGETVTITEAGVYLLSGEIADGQVIVEAGDGETVQLVLNGVNISASSSAPIYVKSADKVFVTLAADSKNTLSVTGAYAQDSENKVDGGVFSKSDITFNGDGELTVNAAYGHGVAGKDDVVFIGGAYTVVAEKHGISANDSVRIADGTFHITSGKDGIQVEYAEDAEQGFLYIANGDFTVNAQGDAISATGAVEIGDGSFTLTTGEGGESVTLQSDGDGLRPGIWQPTATEENGVSQKGVKTDGSLTINDGTFTMDTVDDGLHAAGDIKIAGGTFTIKSGDDGIHSDQAVAIEGGVFSIPYCYEGIEGLSVTVNGGSFDIISSDDGFNAAGGTDGSGLGGRGDPFATAEGAFITINGGDITIVSDGDSLDSNGALTINGGTIRLTCNGNGNTAIDASGAYSNNGGSLTTNDGSESGSHMGGGGPGGGQRPDRGERPQGMKPFEGAPG